MPADRADDPGMARSSEGSVGCWWSSANNGDLRGEAFTEEVTRVATGGAALDGVSAEYAMLPGAHATPGPTGKSVKGRIGAADARDLPAGRAVGSAAV